MQECRLQLHVQSSHELRKDRDCCLYAQTEEALAHARAAGCPIIVALTKCDMPGAEPSRVKNQLLGLGLQLEEAGGNVMVCSCPGTYSLRTVCRLLAVLTCTLVGMTMDCQPSSWII